MSIIIIKLIRLVMDIMGSTIILLAAVYMHHINTTTFVINTCKKVLDICINT